MPQLVRDQRPAQTAFWALPLVPRCFLGRPNAIQLGVEPGVSGGALRQLAGKPPDNGASDAAPASFRFEFGQRRLGIRHSGGTGDAGFPTRHVS
jgi:hypothetical protein